MFICLDVKKTDNWRWTRLPFQPPDLTLKPLKKAKACIFLGVIFWMMILFLYELSLLSEYGEPRAFENEYIFIN